MWGNNSFLPREAKTNRHCSLFFWPLEASSFPKNVRFPMRFQDSGKHDSNETSGKAGLDNYAQLFHNRDATVLVAALGIHFFFLSSARFFTGSRHWLFLPQTAAGTGNRLMAQSATRNWVISAEQFGNSTRYEKKLCQIFLAPETLSLLASVYRV